MVINGTIFLDSIRQEPNGITCSRNTTPVLRYSFIVQLIKELIKYEQMSFQSLFKVIRFLLMLECFWQCIPCGGTLVGKSLRQSFLNGVWPIFVVDWFLLYCFDYNAVLFFYHIIVLIYKQKEFEWIV